MSFFPPCLTSRLSPPPPLSCIDEDDDEEEKEEDGCGQGCRERSLLVARDDVAAGERRVASAAEKRRGPPQGRDWRKIEFLALPTSSRLIGRSRLLFT